MENPAKPPCRIRIQPVARQDFLFAYAYSNLSATGSGPRTEATRSFHHDPVAGDSSRYQVTDSGRTWTANAANPGIVVDTLPYRRSSFESPPTVGFDSFEDLAEALQKASADGTLFLDGCLADSVDTLRSELSSGNSRTEILALHGDTLAVEVSDSGYKFGAGTWFSYSLSTGLLRFGKGSGGFMMQSTSFELSRLPGP